MEKLGIDEFSLFIGFMLAIILQVVFFTSIVAYKPIKEGLIRRKQQLKTLFKHIKSRLNIKNKEK